MKSQSCARWIVGSLIPLFDHRDAQTVMASHKARPPAQALPQTAPGVSVLSDGGPTCRYVATDG